MTDADHSLAVAVRSGSSLRLLFVKMPCAPQIELAASSGFDAVIVDTEHGPGGGIELEHHLRAAAAARIPALVRVPSLDPGAILAALDAGATGIVVPHVVDAADALAAVQAAHYPPRGRRGLALSTRAGRYGAVSLHDHLARAAQETLVIVQIEDGEAIPHADEILTVDGVDGVLIGASDLSISLGHPGDAGHCQVTAAIMRIRAAAQRARAAAAVVVHTPEEAEHWSAQGVSLAVFVATQLIGDGFQRAADRAAPTTPDEPLVLLPGMLGSADLWSEIAEPLRIAVSLRMARVDLDDCIEEMAATVLASAPERFRLAGHSLGAIVALAVMRRAPGRVSGLALLNASARAGAVEDLASWEQMRHKVEADEFDQLVREFACSNVAERRRSDAALITRIEGMAREVGPAGFLRQLRAQRTRPDSRSWLHEIRCPTLLISGEEDQVCPPALQDELARDISGARLERLEGCGHMSPLEAPERVGALLRDWLA